MKKNTLAKTVLSAGIALTSQVDAGNATLEWTKKEVGLIMEVKDTKGNYGDSLEYYHNGATKVIKSDGKIKTIITDDGQIYRNPVEMSDGYVQFEGGGLYALYISEGNKLITGIDSPPVINSETRMLSYIKNGKVEIIALAYTDSKAPDTGSGI